MPDDTPLIEVCLHLEDPPALSSLISALAGIDNQFNKFIRSQYPSLEDHAQLAVKSIRQGSTIFELIPQFAALVANMDTILIVDSFVTRYGGMLKGLVIGNGASDLSKSEVRDYLNTVKLLAYDDNGSATISSATFHKTKTTKRIEFKFDTQEARAAQPVLERRAVEIDLPAHEVLENVLMVFWQSNLKESKTGATTGEKAIIEKLSDRPFPVVYLTDLARERIKHEIGEGHRNLYKLGFFVDCYVERHQGRIVAYKIQAVRDIIELPED